MPKVQKKKLTKEKLIHPNSRKALQLSRKQYHDTKQQRRKDETSVKVQSKLDKFLWFQKQIIDGNYVEMTPTIIYELINKYLKRFDLELQQIQIIQSIRKRQASQHIGRQDSIRFTIEGEKEQFNTNGIELPDFLNKRNFEFFKLWDGNPNQLSALKSKCYCRKPLEDMVKKAESRNNKNKGAETFDISGLFDNKME